MDLRTSRNAGRATTPDGLRNVSGSSVSKPTVEFTEEGGTAEHSWDGDRPTRLPPSPRTMPLPRVPLFQLHTLCLFLLRGKPQQLLHPPGHQATTTSTGQNHVTVGRATPA